MLFLLGKPASIMLNGRKVSGVVVHKGDYNGVTFEVKIRDNEGKTHYARFLSPFKK